MLPTIVFAGSTFGGLHRKKDLEELDDGTTMLHRVLTALGALTFLSPIVVIGLDTSSSETVQGKEGAAIHYLPNRHGLGVSLRSAVDLVGDPGRVLLVMGDLPFLSSEAIRDFLDLAPSSGGIVCSVCRADECLRAFPKIKQTAIELREGAFVLGNIFLLDSSVLKQKGALIAGIYQARKDFKKLAVILGWRLVFDLIVGSRTVSLDDICHAIGVKFSARTFYVISPHPCIATDIDNPEDLRYIAEYSAK